MTVQRRGDFPLHELRRFLESEGWDAVMTEAGTLEASLHGAEGVFRLKADRGGRIYLRCTRPSAPPQSQTITIDDREYAFHTESMRIKEIGTTIEHAGDFPRVLNTMMELILKPSEDAQTR